MTISAISPGIMTTFLIKSRYDYWCYLTRKDVLATAPYLSCQFLFMSYNNCVIRPFERVFLLFLSTFGRLNDNNYGPIFKCSVNWFVSGWEFEQAAIFTLQRINIRLRTLDGIDGWKTILKIALIIIFRFLDGLTVLKVVKWILEH